MRKGERHVYGWGRPKTKGSNEVCAKTKDTDVKNPLTFLFFYDLDYDLAMVSLQNLKYECYE
jgi:hypothetical protein